MFRLKKRAQITIPIKIRESVGIKEGDILDIQIKDDEIILKPLKQKKIDLKPVPASKLKEIEGILSIGGDALEDSEAIWGNE